MTAELQEQMGRILGAAMVECRTCKTGNHRWEESDFVLATAPPETRIRTCLCCGAVQRISPMTGGWEYAQRTRRKRG